MRLDEFIGKLKEYANRTPNVRIFTGNWRGTGADSVPSSVIFELGKITSLLSEKVCPKDKCLLIYNFQPINFEGMSSNHILCEIGAWLRPSSELEKTDQIINGKSLDLLFNGNTKEIVNSTQALLQLKKVELSDLTSDDKPIVYGNARHFNSPIHFYIQSDTQMKEDTEQYYTCNA